MKVLSIQRQIGSPPINSSGLETFKYRLMYLLSYMSSSLIFMKWSIIFLGTMLLLSTLSVFGAAEQADYEEIPKPPAQPSSGPGGSDYACNQVIKSKHGSSGKQYWIYEPTDPTPESALLIVFLHGWSAMDPFSYETWIEHIVKRGNIVVYPKYQASLFTQSKDFTPNAIAAVKSAIEELQIGKHVKPELNNFAIVGHSMGGLMSANMAALSAGLPEPKAIMCVEPGVTGAFELEDLSKIPESTLLLCVTGDRDDVVGNMDAIRIFEESSRIAETNKDLVIVVSDDHGVPSLIADHYAPAAVGKDLSLWTMITSLLRALTLKILKPIVGIPTTTKPHGEVNSLDYYAYWKLFDGLCDGAFYKTNREYALGNTPEQRFMGVWSDGVPVKELIVTDHP